MHVLKADMEQLLGSQHLQDVLHVQQEHFQQQQHKQQLVHVQTVQQEQFQQQEQVFAQIVVQDNGQAHHLHHVVQQHVHKVTIVMVQI